MFTIGKNYDFELLDGVDDDGKPTITTYPQRRVVDVQGPIVKISSQGEESIVNTQSYVFVRATLKS